MTPASAIARESRSAGFSDAGQVRTNNEDRIHFDDVAGIYFVVDGVGGEAAGERAAEIARRTLIENIDPEAADLSDRIRVAIALAGRKIYEAAERNPSWAGMACVLTVAVVRSNKVVVGHVGDSRLYKIRGATIQKITRDHSPVGQMEDSGRISEAEAMAHPRRNEIFRDVGSKSRSPLDQDFIDIFEIDFERDAALLLCSDGLSDEVPSADILSVVKRFAGTPQQVCKELVRQANERGGKDNVSVVYVEQPMFAGTAVRPGPTMNPSENSYRLFHVLLAALLSSVFGAALMWLFLNRQTATAPPTASSASVFRTLVVDPSLKIADAIQLAREGDVVELMPGVYTEQVALKTGVWIVARVPGAAELRARVTADGVSAAVTARGVMNAGLSGIKISAGAGDENSAGVLIEDSQIGLHRVEVVGTSEAAVAIRGNSDVQLNAADVHDNAGGGIVASGPGKFELANSNLFRNGRAGRAVLELDANVQAELRGNVFGANGNLVKSSNQKIIETELYKWNVVMNRGPLIRGQ